MTDNRNYALEQRQRDQRKIEPEPAALVSRVDTEFNHEWMRNHPDLFAQAVMRWHGEHPIEEWSHRICMASRFRIKLIAIRRKEPYDFERDYLREIGMTP